MVSSPLHHIEAASVGTAIRDRLSDSREDKRFKKLEALMKRNRYSQECAIEVLHEAQKTYGCLSAEVLARIARQLQLPASHLFGVATFYHLFSLEPGGTHTCTVCLGTACYVTGGSEILAALERQTGTNVGKTTSDGLVSLLSARCLGACGIAPAVVFDGEVAGRQTIDGACDRVRQWQVRESSETSPGEAIWSGRS